MITPLLVALALGAPPAPLPTPPSDGLPAGLPPGERLVLDNGLVVVLVPQAGNPYLTVQLAFRAGAGADPVELSGLASLTGRLLTAGVDASGSVAAAPVRLDEAALANELARLGGWIGVDVGRESFGVAGQIPTLSDRDVRRFLDLYAAVALAPTFPEALVEREKTLRLAGLERLADDAEGLADLVAEEVALGSGPFGRPVIGRKASIARIARADVVAFHAAVTNPHHGVLVVGGAFDPAAMRAWIISRLGGATLVAGAPAAPDGAPAEPAVGGMPGRLARLCGAGPGARCFGNPLAARTAGTPPPPRTIHVVVDDPSMSQIPYRLVAPNPVNQLDPRWAALRLGTYVLGGDFTSRLNIVLRAREGLTYGAYFETGFGAHRSGAMVVTSDAPPDALARAVTLAQGEIAALVDQPLAAGDLDAFRAMMVNGFAFNFETILATVDQYLALELDALPMTWLAGWREALARPTAAEVQAAMKAAFPDSGKGLSLVVVGPASLDVGPIARGPVTRIDARAYLAGEAPGL